MMKNLLLFSFLILSYFNVSSQNITVNDQAIQDIDVEYVQIVGTSRLLSNKVTIEIDFGQNTKFFSDGKETRIRDDEGKNVKFNSMIDALNFMSSHGFEFVQAYAFAESNQNVYHYLMKKQ